MTPSIYMTFVSNCTITR